MLKVNARRRCASIIYVLLPLNYSLINGLDPLKQLIMATKIRLQRGRKSCPIYSIVVADVRAKRDGRFIEKLGTYNPNTNPATIDLNFDSALSWVMKGAQPTDTARAILSYRGVMMKKHLLEGVRKGALTEEQAEAKYEAWLSDKESKIGANVKAIAEKKAADKTARLLRKAK